MRGAATSPNDLSASAAARAIAQGALGCEELMQACLKRIESREIVVRAWVAVDFERALAQARALDNSTPKGPLHGVPFGVKDVLDVAGFATEMGSPIYKGFRPLADASSVAALHAAGAIAIGKTETCEFAGVTPCSTRNPLDVARTPGGSSSGSGAAVADAMVPFALGTQTGGSVLRPASFCGAVGFKPTYGAIARQGLKLAAESLDTIGFIVRSLDDLAVLYNVMTMGADALIAPFDGRPTFGLCRTSMWDAKASPETRASVEMTAQAARAAGAEVVDIDLPRHFARLTQTRAVVNDVERARSLAWEWANRRDALSPAMQAIIARGASIPFTTYQNEVQTAERLRVEFDSIAQAYDGIIAPCVNGEAPLGLDEAGDPSLQSLWTILHAPTLALPAARGPHGMPVAVQLVGRRWRDERLIASALWLRAAGVGQEME